ncbi:thiamine biosynthesis protein MoeB [Sporolactobacillus sp. THM7-7]|nr:thiamine biosynthesis protein MoeB [Sporolactobacillus sp. THM7-7]
MRFDPIGESGQEALLRAKVFIAGAGALGTHAASMLVRAGVGHVTLIDRDYVEKSNLQRQVLFTEEDARQVLPKAVAAERHLKEINQTCDIHGIVGELSGHEPPEVFRQADFVIDATDNFETRFIINDLSQKYGVPWVYGGAVGAAGTTFTIIPGQTPCLACLLNHLPILAESCDRVGVIAPIIQWVSAHQVTEAIKWLTGNRPAMRHTLLYENLWTNEHAAIRVDTFKNTHCPSCGNKRTYPYLKPASVRTSVLCGRDTVHIHPGNLAHPDLEGVKIRLRQRHLSFVNHDALIQVMWNGHRVVLFHDGRALIHGTKDVHEAEQIYLEMIGTELNK